MKRSSLQRKTPLKRSTNPLVTRKPMKRVSTKQSRINASYTKIRIKFLEEHPYCQLCGAMATQIHHRKRRGIHTLDTEFFLPCCFFCHRKIEENGKWSRENGYIID